MYTDDEDLEVFYAMHRAHLAAAARVERVVLEALARAGAPVDYIEGCYRLDDERFARAVPVLLEHLSRDNSDSLRETIARPLCDRRARPWWGPIKALYLQEPDEKVRQRLGAALCVLALRKNWDELVELVNNEDLGISRVFLLRPARRIGNRMDGTSGTKLVEQFRSHPCLGNEASAILKGLGSNEG